MEDAKRHELEEAVNKFLLASAGRPDRDELLTVVTECVETMTKTITAVEGVLPTAPKQEGN